MSHEDAIAYAEVFDHVAANVDIVANLEVLPAMLLSRLLILVWDDEIVDNALNGRCLVIEVVLVLFYALLASKVDISISEVDFLAILRSAESVPLNIVIIHGCINGNLWVSSLRFVADQT